jgi:hypothetical protein
MKRIASFVLLVTLCALVFGNVEIIEENRVANIGSKEEPGFCAWACLSMLGRHHKIEALYDLVEKRANESDFLYWDRDKGVWVAEPYVWVYYKKGKEKELRCSGSEMAMINKLDELKVKYKIQKFGNKNRDIINYAMEKNLGCLIVVSSEAFEGFENAHAVVLTDYDEKEIRFIDPNDISTPYKVDRTWFDRYWTGCVVVVEK